MIQLRNFTPRLYQQTILDSCIRKSCLVVLPTGLGKTGIALMLGIHRLNNFPDSKIILVSPTKPLNQQHVETFREHSSLSEEEVALFTGAIRASKRVELLKKARVIIGTPQTIEIDIINRRIDLSQISCFIFDECHRAVKDYSYTFLAKQYRKQAHHPLILGMTASPGSDLSSIQDVCKNLFIEEIEVRTSDDPDVAPYNYPLEIDWRQIPLSEELQQAQQHLETCFRSKLTQLSQWGLVAKLQNTVSKTQLLELQGRIHGHLSRGERDVRYWQGISLTAEALKAHHALEMLETQGVGASLRYINGVYEESMKSKVKAIQNLVRDISFKSSYVILQKLHEEGIEHPKVKEVCSAVKEATLSGAKRILVFNQFRDSAAFLVGELNKIEGVRCKLFVGQLKKGGVGMSQKEQIQTLQDFRDGHYNVLVGTSVSEEGIDMPSVDLVIFYEPVASAIRTIQRRGRSGRHQEGKVIVLMTKGTRDEAHHWIAHRKEKRMYSLLKDLKKKITLERQEPISSFVERKDISFIADVREKSSALLKHLVDQGINVRLEQISVGDYLLSERCAVEIKTKPDFVASIIDRRLFEQVKALRSNYEVPLLIVQGEEDIYSLRKVHPNALQGALSSILLDFKVPILYTKNHLETAGILIALAKREHEKGNKEAKVGADHKPLSLPEQQEFIVQALPGIGPQLAKNLLQHFGSVEKIMNASVEELCKVEKIGDKKALEVRRVLKESYSP